MFNPEYLTISLFSLSLLIEKKLNEKKQKLMVSFLTGSTCLLSYFGMINTEKEGLFLPPFSPIYISQSVVNANIQMHMHIYKVEE